MTAVLPHGAVDVLLIRHQDGSTSVWLPSRRRGAQPIGLHAKCRCGHAAREHLVIAPNVCMHDVDAWAEPNTIPMPDDTAWVWPDHCRGFDWPHSCDEAWAWPRAEDYVR
jgi:hypothetical protein